jgi:NADH:ubiquinone oxidoreductase subunit E
MLMIYAGRCIHIDHFFFIFTNRNSRTMNHRREIIICLGSSCFSRGNKNLLKIIQRFVVHNGLTEKVFFKGDHCFGECIEGPNIKIGGRMFNHVSEDNVQQILKESLGDLIKTGG